MFRYHIILVAFCLLSFEKGLSQSYVLRSEFQHILDNREYFTKYGYPQTILGARLNLIAGVKIDKSSSVHAGFNYMYEYGGSIDEVPVQLNLFYKYQDKRLKAYFGSFPRKKLLNYPKVMLTDTLNYYRPNIDGAWLGYSNKSFHTNIWCDWVSRQTKERRESFLAGLSGGVKYKMFYADYYAYMCHVAGDASFSQEVIDNGAMAGFIGIDLTSVISYFKRVSIDIGVINSYLRQRPEPYANYVGVMSRVKLHVNRLGIDAVMYSGKPQHLIYGDMIYKSGNYQRIDLFAEPYKSKTVRTRLSFNLHFVDGDFNTSQQLMIIASFDSKKTFSKGIFNEKTTQKGGFMW